MPIATSELPPATPELVLIAALTRCFLRTMSKRERLDFLRDVAGELAWQQEHANVINIRPPAQARAVAEARAKAAAWFSAVAAQCQELAK